MINISLYPYWMHITVDTKHYLYSDEDIDYIYKCADESEITLSDLGISRGIHSFDTEPMVEPDKKGRLYEFLRLLTYSMIITVS